jgi:hypothetical protein
MNAARSFEQNLHSDPLQRTVVFQGTVAIPASAATVGRTVGWTDPQDVVEIVFTAPFTHTGGNVCVDITGSSVAGAEAGYWPVEGVADSSRGSKAEFGQPCGFIAGVHRYVPASVDDDSLVPGCTAVFWSRGPAHAGGGFLIGVPSPSFDLGLLGIADRGCMLEVAPFAVLGASFDKAVLANAAGTARIDLQIPSEPSSLALGFRAQFVAISGAQASTSNALDVSIASTMPALGVAVVRASAPATVGDVRTNRAPVLRFGLR